MPRPKKCRRVCGLPKHPCFGPVGEKDVLTETVFMTVDEYETVRLIDLEGLTQEECSLRMNIARTTVQAIYIKARKKLADCLVNAKNLKIEGGDYRLCDGKAGFCNNKHCCRRCEPRG